MGFESIVAKVRALPPMPESVQKIQALFARGEPPLREIVAVIERDPLLTAEILGKANAPYYGLRNNIVSPMQAVTLFGAVAIRGFVFGASAYRPFDIDISPYGVSTGRFMELCNLQSALTFQWYLGVDVERAKMLIPIAFMLEVGKVVIAREIVESSYAAEFREALHSGSIEAAEREFAGVTTAEVNAMLFEQWHFEAEFIDTMRYLDEEKEPPDAIRELVEALRVVHTCINIKEGMGEATIEAAKRKAERYGLDPVRFEHAALRIWQKSEALKGE